MTPRCPSFRILACSAFAGLVLASGGATAQMIGNASTLADPQALAKAQPLWLDRLPAEQLQVTAPSERVTGEPGRMRIAARDCPAADDADLRRRIVDILAQEWAFFGFNVVDETAFVDDDGGRDRRRRGSWRRFSWLDAAESARVAASIAGYWAATQDGNWILSRQNDVWSSAAGIGARWQDPWSAAFISWVMCESGLGSADRFQRHIAHHVYIDQAIAARDDADSSAAFVAHDVGERPLEPGDMVCRARRGAYRSIADRRPYMGVGVRSHCDIVVKVDAERAQVLAIGGNVRGKVSLKLLPATFEQRGEELLARSIGSGSRTIFAHLKLRAPAVGADALENTPTLRALSDQPEMAVSLERQLAGEAPQATFPSGSVLASP